MILNVFAIFVHLAFGSNADSLSAPDTSRVNYREAIIGLKWGWSPSQIEAKGEKITFGSCSGNFCMYVLSTPSKPLSWVSDYVLVFGDNKLLRIIMKSKRIQNDPYGSEAKRIFAFADSVISIKHKVYHSASRIMQKGFRAPEDFFKCLAYPGCGEWASYYKGDGKEIGLEIRPLNKGFENEGWVITTVEAAPELAEFYKKERENSKKSDAEAM